MSELGHEADEGEIAVSLHFGGLLKLRTPKSGDTWTADLSVIAAEGLKPSAAVYLTSVECRDLGTWLIELADSP